MDSKQIEDIKIYAACFLWLIFGAVLTRRPLVLVERQDFPLYAHDDKGNVVCVRKARIAYRLSDG